MNWESQNKHEKESKNIHTTRMRITSISHKINARRARCTNGPMAVGSLGTNKYSDQCIKNLWMRYSESVSFLLVVMANITLLSFKVNVVLPCNLKNVRDFILVCLPLLLQSSFTILTFTKIVSTIYCDRQKRVDANRIRAICQCNRKEPT